MDDSLIQEDTMKPHDRYVKEIISDMKKTGESIDAGHALFEVFIVVSQSTPMKLCSLVTAIRCRYMHRSAPCLASVVFSDSLCPCLQSQYAIPNQFVLW
jgi:hypothetical protein